MESKDPGSEDPAFGYDTMILKENNLCIYFDDTSYLASYPTNDWRIQVNDSTNGGRSYFSVYDFVALLIKVAQEQQKTISELRERLDKIERRQ